MSRSTLGLSSRSASADDVLTHQAGGETVIEVVDLDAPSKSLMSTPMLSPGTSSQNGINGALQDGLDSKTSAITDSPDPEDPESFSPIDLDASKPTSSPSWIRRALGNCTGAISTRLSRCRDRIGDAWNGCISAVDRRLFALMATPYGIEITEALESPTGKNIRYKLLGLHYASSSPPGIKAWTINVTAWTVQHYLAYEAAKKAAAETSDLEGLHALMGYFAVALAYWGTAQFGGKAEKYIVKQYDRMVELVAQTVAHAGEIKDLKQAVKDLKEKDAQERQHLLARMAAMDERQRELETRLMLDDTKFMRDQTPGRGAAFFKSGTHSSNSEVRNSEALTSSSEASPTVSSMGLTLSSDAV